MRKSILAIAIALAVASPVAAQDDARIPLSFEEFPITAANVGQYWADQLPLVPTDTVSTPVALISSLPTSTGGTFVVTYISAPFYCGINTCPVRVFEDGVEIGGFLGCDAADGYALSADGRYIYACEDTIDLEAASAED